MQPNCAVYQRIIWRNRSKWASGLRKENYIVDLEVFWNDSRLRWGWDYTCEWLTQLEIKKRSHHDLLLELNFSSQQLYPWLPSLQSDQTTTKESSFVSEGESSEWLIFQEKDKPIFTKHSLNSCVISQDLCFQHQSQSRAGIDLFFFKSRQRTFCFVFKMGNNYFFAFGALCDKCCMWLRRLIYMGMFTGEFIAWALEQIYTAELIFSAPSQKTSLKPVKLSQD